MIKNDVISEIDNNVGDNADDDVMEITTIILYFQGYMDLFPCADKDSSVIICSVTMRNL